MIPQNTNTAVPEYNPLDAISLVHGEMTVDQDKLDLDYRPQTSPPAYTPIRTLAPYESRRKLYLDIETTGLDPANSRVIMVGLMKAGGTMQGTRTCIITDQDEEKLLRETMRILNKGVSGDHPLEYLYGHNIFEFDLPFLIARCKHYGIPHPFRFATRSRKISASSVFGAPIEFTPVFWGGAGDYGMRTSVVSILDSYQQCGVLDKSRAILSSYGLKNAVIELGLRTDRRLELGYEQILEYWNNGDTEPIEKYLRYDLEDTALLCDYLFPSVYFQGEIVPNQTFQELSYSSPASKWENIYESLYPGTTRPVSEEKVWYPGADVSCQEGLYKNCSKIDVNSLYPSLQVRYHLVSRKDPECKAVGVIKYLLETRLYKKKLGAQGDTHAQQQADALKILANSGYGFLGVGGYPYNDMSVAALVTGYGIKVLHLMQRTLTSTRCFIVESDTDGVIFQNNTDFDNLDVLARVNESLPSGITASLEWQNTSVYMPKLKNYLLINQETQKVKATGQFRKRNVSAIQREFVQNYVVKFLHSQDLAEGYYEGIKNVIACGEADVNMFKLTQKIRKGDVMLTGAGLGKEGERVTYYFAEKKGEPSKRGGYKKSSKRPVTEGQYWIDYYLDELNKMYADMQNVIQKSNF